MLPCNVWGNAMAGKGWDTLDVGRAPPLMGTIPAGVGVWAGVGVCGLASNVVEVASALEVDEEPEEVVVFDISACSTDFGDDEGLEIVEVASLTVLTIFSELFLEDGSPGRTDGSQLPAVTSLLPRRSSLFVLPAFSTEGALGTGAVVIHGLIGCK